MKKLFVSLLITISALSFCACGFNASAPTELPAEVSDSVQAELPVETPTVYDEDWKTEFEASLLEQYGVVPERYEDLGDGWYQVYVMIEGQSVPYVAVDSATGFYHG